MFTDEFIIKACEYARKKDLASNAKEALLNLGINNKGVITDLDNVVAAADSNNLLAVNYMLSFVPKEVLQVIEFISAYGAYTMFKSNQALQTVIVLHGVNGDLLLKFDNTNKCLYIDAYSSTSAWLYSEVSKYIGKDPGRFNTWIYVK